MILLVAFSDSLLFCISIGDFNLLLLGHLPRGFYELHCLLEVCMLKPQTCDMTVFGDGDFKEIIKVKRGHKVGALIQWDWCPYRTRYQEYVHSGSLT